MRSGAAIYVVLLFWYRYVPSPNLIFVPAFVLLAFQIHCEAPDAISFTAVDTEAEGTARGDYAGHIPGIIRANSPLKNSGR